MADKGNCLDDWYYTFISFVNGQDVSRVEQQSEQDAHGSSCMDLHIGVLPELEQSE